MDRTKDIIKKINAMSGSKSPYEVFSDWIKCTALAMAQTTIFSPKREAEYMDTIKKYNAIEFVKLTALLSETIECGMNDVLGNLFMASGWGNKNTGQFFTPYAVSLASALCTYTLSEDIVTMEEPAAGAGGMIIAMAEAMQRSGVNHQKKLRVVARDLDYNAYYMCYIQLALYGIDAKCVQGNTLEGKSFSVFDDNVMVTPMFIINGGAW